MNLQPRRPRLIISGWYGHGNLGDEALLEGIVQAVRQAEPDLEIGALCDGDPTFMRDNLRIGVYRRGRWLPRKGAELFAVLRCTALAVGGGGLIKDYGDRPGVVHDWLWPLTAARRLRKRTMTYAIGVDDVRFPESVAITRSVLPALDVTTVRDAGVAQRLAALEVEAVPVVTADPALLLGTPLAAETGPNVAVSVRHWFDHGAVVERPELVERFQIELAAALDALVDEHGISVTFIPFREQHHDDDTIVCRAVAERMRHAAATRVVGMPASPRAAVALLGEHALIVGMRLHSLILGATTATPIFALTYMPKVTDFMNEVGLAEQMVALDEGAQPEVLTAALAAAYRSRAETRAHLRQAVPPLQERALGNGEIAAALAVGDGRRVQAAVAALEGGH